MTIRSNEMILLAMPTWISEVSGKDIFLLLAGALLGALVPLLKYIPRVVRWLRADNAEKSFHLEFQKKSISLNKIHEWQSNPYQFFIDALQSFIHWALFVIFGILALMIFSITDVVVHGLREDLIFGIFYCSALTMSFLYRLQKDIEYFRDPTILLQEMQTLYRTGHENKWMSDDDIDYAKRLMEINFDEWRQEFREAKQKAFKVKADRLRNEQAKEDGAGETDGII